MITLPTVGKGGEKFSFDPGTHRYKIGEKYVPSITQVLKLTGFNDKAEFYSQESRDRGHAVHAACSYYLKGTLDAGSVSSEIYGYVDGLKSFLGQKTYEVLMTEQPAFSRWFGFAGTADCILKVGKENVLVEIKTGVDTGMSADLQVAAQDILLEENDIGIDDHLLLFLKDNGKSNVRRVENVRFYRKTFLSLLAVVNERINRREIKL